MEKRKIRPLATPKPLNRSSLDDRHSADAIVSQLFLEMVMHASVSFVTCFIAACLSASEMTYIVSSGALNSTHSLALWLLMLQPTNLWWMHSLVRGKKECAHRRTGTGSQILRTHVLNKDAQRWPFLVFNLKALYLSTRVENCAIKFST